MGGTDREEPKIGGEAVRPRVHPFALCISAREERPVSLFY